VPLTNHWTRSPSVRELDHLLRTRQHRIDFIASVCDGIRDACLRCARAPLVLLLLAHQPAYSAGNSNFPSAVNQFPESSFGSVPFKNSSLILNALKRDASNPVSGQISRRTRRPLSSGGSSGRSRRSNSRINAAQSGVAERTANVSRIGRPSKFPAQTATVCSLSKPTVHGITKAAAGSSFCSDPFLKRER